MVPKKSSLVEMSLGVAIGAITFTGSIIAFLKLQGLISGAKQIFFAQHFINLIIFIALIILTITFTIDVLDKYLLVEIMISIFIIGFFVIIPIRVTIMPVVVSMHIYSYSG